MKVLSTQIGWTDKDGTQRIAEQGQDVPTDAPKDKVDFWQKVGMVGTEKKADDKPAAKK